MCVDHMADVREQTSSESSGALPFVPAGRVIPELTVRAVIAGTLLGMVFGASSLYLVLKVGLTVSASIPVAVISLSLFRSLVQDHGGAGCHDPGKQHRPNRRVGRGVDRLRSGRDHAGNSDPGV